MTKYLRRVVTGSLAVLLLLSARENTAQPLAESGFWWEIQINLENASSGVIVYVATDDGLFIPKGELQVSAGTVFNIDTDNVYGPGPIWHHLGFENTDFYTFEFRSLPPGNTLLGRFVFSDTWQAFEANEANFFKPGLGLPSGSPDTVFEVADADGGELEVIARNPGGSSPGFESLLGDRYVYPYDCVLNPGCEVLYASSPGRFFARVDSVPTATERRFTFTSANDAVVRSDWEPVWDDPALILEFPARTQLIAEGSLVMEGVTLTEAVEGEGWYGVRYEPDGGGVIRGTTIEKFGFTPPPGAALRPQVCGLTVNDRWLAVHRSFIQDGINGAHGVCSSGDEAQVALWDENGDRTIVRRNNGDGLRASNQGRFLVRNGEITLNGLNGGTSMGIGSVIYAYSNSTFSDNDGVGLASLYDGNVILYEPNGSSNLGTNTLDRNFGGGLLAQGQGSYINAGTFNGAGILGTCVGACENNILNHDLPPSPFDAKAFSGSLIFAEYDFWGEDRDDRSDLNLIEQGSGVIEVDPIWDGMSLREGPVAMKSEGEPSAFRETARGLIIKAFENSAQGRWIPALAHAQAAVALATGEDEISMAMGAVSALLGHPDAPDMPIGLLIAIEAHLGIGQQGRPYALRSLLSSHRTQGRDADARTTAQALIADFPRTGHALAGLAQEVELALEADDLPGAQAAMATMEADHPDDLLTEVTRAYFVLLAGEEALPAPGAATPIAASATVSDASASTEAIGFVLHSAYPNPFNPQVVVPFTVSESATVRVRVFDMLGRQVTTLADGRYEPGQYDSVFDGSLLPSGMYLLRADVTQENENSAQTMTQRITLLK